MKQTLLLSVALMVAFPAISASKTLYPEDTIITNNKKIVLNDDNERINVKVYEISQDGNTFEYEQIFEGQYRDGRSYERRKYMSIIPIPGQKKSKNYFDGHWGGFGIGFNNFVDKSDGIDLKSEKSLEINFNFLEKNVSLSSRYKLGLVTGLGLRWNRYHFENNLYMKEVDGITSLHPAPEGITYQKTRLGTTSFVLPLFIEWQKSSFFLSAGVESVVKAWSSSKVKYKDEHGHRQKDKIDSGMNIHPVTFDFLFKFGFRAIGVYTKYSPMGLFEKNKGPKVYPVSTGLMLYF